MLQELQGPGHLSLEGHIKYSTLLVILPKSIFLFFLGKGRILSQMLSFPVFFVVSCGHTTKVIANDMNKGDVHNTHLTWLKGTCLSWTSSLFSSLEWPTLQIKTTCEPVGRWSEKMEGNCVSDHPHRAELPCQPRLLCEREINFYLRSLL